ncbi:MAG: MATE family efflux transporter, partial [Acidimicrobiales bacterium]
MGAARAARRAPRLGPLDRELLRQTLPAFATLVAEPLYVLADTAVVGRLGADELGGLALASTVLLSAHSLCIFLAYGTTAAVARLVGAGEERRAARQGVQGLWLAALLGSALALLGAVGGRSLVDALGGGGPAVAPGWLYLRISLLGVPAMLVGLAGVGYLRGRQDTRTPLLITAASASFNLVLEVVLIFGLGFGIGASAAATVAAQWGAAAVYAAQVLRRGRALGASAAPDWRAMRALGAVGAHLFVRSAALRGSFTLATAAAARAGRVDLAAHQIAFEVWSFLALALDAVGIAAQAIVGRLLG